MSADALLLRRKGLVILPAGSALGDAALVSAAETELAALGYVVSRALRARLMSLDTRSLGVWLDQTTKALWDIVGGERSYVPLYRKFPEGVPADTAAHWLDRVIVHYLQSPHQPCLFCGRVGTTHVLKPCAHVVCGACWDGENFSACPICQHAVDRSSPFFAPGVDFRPLSQKEWVTFKLLDLCEDPEGALRGLCTALLTRTAGMNADDAAALVTLVQERGLAILAWIPEKIPVRENRALVFGTLMRSLPHAEVLAAGRPHLRTATDILRLLAVYSGASAGLLPQIHMVYVENAQSPRLSASLRERIRILMSMNRWRGRTQVPVITPRFRVARLPRASRRLILAMLESFPPDALARDMLRHPSIWVGVGEALHPFEYADRFPNTARAFAVVRKSRVELPHAANADFWRDAKGRQRFRSRNAQTEALIQRDDAIALTKHLAIQPGELARRLDLALRLSTNPEHQAVVSTLFGEHAPSMTTPVLLTLATTLARRDKPGSRRVFFPKSEQFGAPSAADTRAPLPRALLAPLIERIEAILLSRFAEKAPFGQAVLDRALQSVPVPFHERSASPAAVNLPRGAFVDVEEAKFLRLFLHWCQPPNGRTTDLDLSVGLYDERWALKASCAYYSLRVELNGEVLARSSGDRQDAPHPEGATEYVDLDREVALRSGLRYAVMLVNAFDGLPFAALERGYAGLMARNDAEGATFDPRKVTLRFNLRGAHGVFVPLVYDIQRSRLFWVDASTAGQLAFNNLHTSSAQLVRICSETMAYFASGVRPSLFQLAALHAAARCPEVLVREPEGLRRFVRGPEESTRDFYHRLLSGEAEGPGALAGAGPVFAALLHGDLPIPEKSMVYALFREQLTDTIAAAELLA